MINRINTACAFCVFRKNDENGDQVSCELGRLEKFIERGEANKKDDYYVIERFCNTCSAQPISKEAILEQVEVNYCLIVYGWNDFWLTLKSIPKLNIKPKEVYVIFDDLDFFDKDKYKEYSELFRNANIQLTFKRYYDGSSATKIIDDIIERTKTQYYSYIKHPLPRNFADKYNKIINYDMQQLNAHITHYRFGSIFNNFISCVLHRRLGGNAGKKGILKKIVEKIEEEKEKEHPNQKGIDSVIIDE